ncbi:hypothetical protein [Georgenia yuyongxinii]
MPPRAAQLDAPRRRWPRRALAAALALLVATATAIIWHTPRTGPEPAPQVVVAPPATNAVPMPTPETRTPVPMPRPQLDQPVPMPTPWTEPPPTAPAPQPAPAAPTPWPSSRGGAAAASSAASTSTRDQPAVAAAYSSSRAARYARMGRRRAHHIALGTGGSGCAARTSASGPRRSPAATSSMSVTGSIV